LEGQACDGLGLRRSGLASEPVGDLTSCVEERATFFVRLRVRLLGQIGRSCVGPSSTCVRCWATEARVRDRPRGLVLAAGAFLIRSALGSMREYAAPARSDG